MVTPISEGLPLWEASEERKQQANVTRYMQWLAETRKLHFATREYLWQWSVTHIEDFWASLWEYFHIKASKPYKTVLVERKMPGAVSYTHLRAHETRHDLVCRLLLEKKK